MKRKVAHIFLLIISVTILGIFNPVYSAEASPLDKETVKVGCMFPLAGPGGLYGRDSLIAIKMALADLKSSKKYDYPDIDVLFGDTRSKSHRAVQIARNFINKDKVDFLCGVVSSQIALAVTDISRENKVFFIGTDHASPSLINESLHPYYFRVNNGTRQSMRAGAKYIQSNFKTKKKLKIAFIGPDYEYGYQAWDDLRFFLKEQRFNFEVVGEFWPKLFETDYSIYIHEINRSKPDIVINGHWGQDFVTFIKQAKPLGLFDQSQVMNFDTGGNYETLAEMGDEMPLGIILSARHHVNWPETKANRDFVNGFYERAGRFPSYAAEGAYAGIIAIGEALRIAKGVKDKKALQLALENLVVNLPEDPKGFSSKMDPKTHQMMQAQAIGKTILNNDYAPAKVLLGDWFVFMPE
ncbi:ABC transporter substrate-binding protein [Cocleimonas flava]|uniref:Amino acid/amide ABC transporter substrate-binding protein (HAAT family) n=1 Tax=Cocleimonas flava TaxID=634765 RepID=A0A4R1EP94_9GAMM|nr:ABC transporter substrate-binding protein [Cocleimonas flava]TCJ83106.1 amino acid/amide ABC transporter substrate-binding protein (HAAT family) [Cocleimonas flava]